MFEPLTEEQQRFSEVNAWLDLADGDYVAARTLIRNGQIIQGAILSSTAIEKYLKTIYWIKGREFERRGENAHDIVKLYNGLTTLDPRGKLNESYLRLLIRAHKLRYPDRLEPGFSIALSQVKMLVALDETVFKMRSGIKFVGAERKGEFEQQIENNDEFLLQGNHTFGNAKRVELFQRPLLWNEMRVVRNGSWLRISYVAMAEDDGEYDLGGLIPGSSDREFKIQSPIQEEKNVAKTSNTSQK